MTQPPIRQTTYCLNPDCPQPQQVNQPLICPYCGFRVWLGDRYRAIQLLGEGASGRTWLAIDQQAIDQQAIDQAQSSPISDNFSVNGNVNTSVHSRLYSDVHSMVYPIVQQSPKGINFLSLFQEGQRWRELGQHPQLPALLDWIEQDSYQYVVQEYIPGESLAKVLSNQGKFGASEVWQVLESLLPVLQFLHTQGVIHRDIKPDNIIVQGNGNELALVDFKAAILPGRDSAKVSTQTASFSQTVLGSAYAAPEQIRGQPTFASDLYSLGVTCIHLLTEMHPFHLMDAATHTWIWQNYWIPESTNTADRLSQQHLVQFLDRLIAPDLNQRFATATEAIATLQKLRGKRSSFSKMVPAQPSNWICYATLVGHQGLFANVNAIAIAPDHTTVASASDDKTIRLWNSHTGADLGVLEGHTQFVTTIAFHPHKAELLVSGSRDRTLKLWHWPDRQEICTLIGHDKAVNTVLFTPDGNRLISGSADKTVKVWAIDSGRLIASLSGHRLAVNGLAYATLVPGCSHPVLATASTDTTVKLWNLDTYTCMQTLTGHTAAVKAVAFSPSGEWLATAGDDHTIRLWDMVSRQCHRVLTGHSWPVSALLFTANAELLISSSEDKTIKVWQISTGQETATLVGHTDAVSSVAIDSNQHFIASSSHDKTVKLWKMDLAGSSFEQ